MIVELFGLSELNCSNVRFYSVKIGENPNTEYRDFVIRNVSTEESKLDIKELHRYIKEKIGNNSKGAEERFFKKEDFADRIKQPETEPFDEFKPDPKNYGLRLYCLRLSEKIVILFNGANKTYKKAIQCPNCQPFFEKANQMSKAIDEAIYIGKIRLDGFDIIFEDDEFELHI